MKTIKIKNRELHPVIKTLTYEMPFKDSRIKNRIIDTLIKEYDKYEKNRIDIVTKFADKDESGKFIFVDSIDEKGNIKKIYSFSDENLESFNKEYEILVNEEVCIDMTPSVQTYFVRLKEFIENSPVKISISESFHVENFLEELDKETEKVAKKK